MHVAIEGGQKDFEDTQSLSIDNKLYNLRQRGPTLDIKPEQHTNYKNL